MSVYKQANFSGQSCLPLDKSIVGPLQYGNLTTYDKLDVLGQSTKDAVNNIATSGQFLTELHYLSLYLIELHSAQLKAEVPQLAATLSSNYKLYTETLKSFIQDKNTIPAQITSLEDQFKKLKDDIKTTIHVNSTDQSSIVWARYEKEASILYEQVKAFIDTIYHATQDIKNAQPMLKNKGLTLFESSDVITLSNFSIFEQIDYEIQKPSYQQLRNIWTGKLAKFFQILQGYPTLGRINPSGQGLLHVPPTTPVAVKSSGPNAVPFLATEKYSLTTQTAYDSLGMTAIEMLEKSLGLVLEEFYSAANGEIQKLAPNSLLRKFCRPFGINNLTKSIYSRNLMPDYSKANLQFLIGAASGAMDVDSDMDTTVYEMEMPNHIVSMNRAGNIQFNPKPSWLGGKCCGGIRYPLDRTYYSDDQVEMVGRGGANTTKRKTTTVAKRTTTKKRRTNESESESSSSSSSSSEDDDQAAPRKKAAVDASATTMSGRIKFQSVQGLMKMFQEISYMLKTLKETSFNPFNSAIMSLKNHLDDIFRLQTIFSTEGKDTQVKPSLVVAKGAEELLNMYINLIKANSSVSDLTKDLYAPSENFIASALVTMKRPVDTTIAPYDIHLPEKLRYSHHAGLISNFWQLESMINAYVQSIFTEASLFSNPNTGFSFGKINLSEDSFELKDKDRVVTFKNNSAVESEIRKFKEKLRITYYKNIVDMLTSKQRELKNAVSSANTLFDKLKSIIGTGTDTATLNRKKFITQLAKKTTCGRTVVFGPAIEDAVADSELGHIAARLYDSSTNVNFITYANNNPNKKLWDYIGDDTYAGVMENDSDFICFWNNAFTSTKDEIKNSLGGPPDFFNSCKKFMDKLYKMIGQYTYSDSSPHILLQDAALDGLLKKFQNAYDKINLLNVASFEKKFSTPVIPNNVTTVDAFINNGYGEFIKQFINIVLWFMGPTGSGKTFCGYGKESAGAVGLDSRFLSLPRTALYFRDYYYGCFFCYESFLRAIDNPVVINYNILSDGSVVASDNTSGVATNVSGGQLKDYKTKIDDKRRGTYIRDTSRGTSGNRESSRSFFTTVVVEDTVEKRMVDTPGYESISRPAYLNPFLFIHNFIITHVENNTGRQLYNNFEFDNFKAEGERLLVSALTTAGVFTSDELKANNGSDIDWLKMSPNVAVPTPQGCNFDEHGITSDCTFDHLVSQTIAFFDRNVKTDRLVARGILNLSDGNEILADGRNITVRDKQVLVVKSDGARQSSSLFGSTVSGNKSTGLYRLDGNTKHNICINTKVALYMWWTYLIYQKLFSLPLPNMRIIQDRFMKMAPGHEVEILASVEACFFNNFNFWAQHATLRLNNKSLVNYFNENIGTNKTVTTGDLFHEYMLIAGDYAFTGSAGNIGLPRHKFGMYALSHQNRTSENQISLSLLNITYKRYSNWNFTSVLDTYNNFSTIFNPFLPLGDLEVFNKLMGVKQGTKNLFVTILHGGIEKVENYCTFFDINTQPTVTGALPIPAP